VFTHVLHPRFSDIDVYNHVNNAVYLTYFEEARMAFTHTCGLRALYSRECSTIIAHADIDYKAPALLHDTLHVQLTVAALKRSSFAFVYTIVRSGDQRVIATGNSVQVCFNFVLNAPVRVPESWRVILNQHLVENETHV
jgi:acyl-CoA thioester hydrolase